MFTTILTIAGALAQAYGTAPATPAAPVPPVVPATPATPATPAAPAATPVGRTLKDLPNTTITYYDVTGKTAPAIEKSLKKILADPAQKDAVQLFTWTVGVQLTKHTVGQKCTIAAAKSTLTPTVQLPRLAEEAKVPKDVLAQWRTYVAGVESDAAANLWFIKDRLPALEQSLVGQSCDQAPTAWNAGIENLKPQLAQFAAQRAQAAQTPAAKPASEDVKLPDGY